MERDEVTLMIHREVKELVEPLERRIANMETKQSLYDKEMAVLNVILGGIESNLTKIDKKLDATIEKQNKRTAGRWDKVIDTGIVGVVSAMIGAVISLILIK